MANHLALGVRGDSNGVAARARLSTHEGVLIGRRPAPVTDVALRHLVVICVGRGSSQHTETLQSVSDSPFSLECEACLLESGSLSAGNVVDVQTTLVDELALRATVSSLGNTNVRSVLVVEEHNSGPVVGLVLDEGARRAGGKLSGVIVGVHGNVEAVATNDLVQMGSVLQSRVDERIRSLDDKL